MVIGYNAAASNVLHTFSPYRKQFIPKQTHTIWCTIDIVEHLETTPVGICVHLWLILCPELVSSVVYSMPGDGIDRRCVDENYNDCK